MDFDITDFQGDVIERSTKKVFLKNPAKAVTRTERHGANCNSENDIEHIERMWDKAGMISLAQFITVASSQIESGVAERRASNEVTRASLVSSRPHPPRLSITANVNSLSAQSFPSEALLHLPLAPGFSASTARSAVQATRRARKNDRRDLIRNHIAPPISPSLNAECRNGRQLLAITSLARINTASADWPALRSSSKIQLQEPIRRRVHAWLVRRVVQRKQARARARTGVARCRGYYCVYITARGPPRRGYCPDAGVAITYRASM